MDSPKFFEGDIFVRPEEKFVIDNGLNLQPGVTTFGASKNKRWPKGIVPYTFADSLSTHGVNISCI